MFNQFEGNEDDREAKQEERLRLLKNLRESGYFDEEGTEEVPDKATGTNPCDPDPSLIFTGETPEPKSGVFKRPMGVSEAERKLRGLCPRCGGHGDLLMYGDSLARCPACDGTGRDDTLSCVVCTGEGSDRWGQVCVACNERGLEPA